MFSTPADAAIRQLHRLSQRADTGLMVEDMLASGPWLALVRQAGVVLALVEEALAQ